MKELLFMMTGALCLLLAAVAVAYAVYVLRRLERLLDAAQRGQFDEKHWDEGRVSRLETRLAQLLRAGVLSRRRLDEDRARIKELIGDISHQTKTPLSNISLYAQLLGEQTLSAQARAMAAQIAAQSDKLEFLIRSLVKLSRLESGIVRTRPTVQPLMPLLMPLQAEYSPAACAKEMTLTIGQADFSACYDLKWTREALGNLVDNAIKYTPRGGHIRISAKAYSLFACIEVCDDGPGIPEEEHAQVFGRFCRGKAAQDAEGVGIGLYLARQIAAQQGGYLRLLSARGTGAAFALYLPREAACGNVTALLD